jgi:hypothetical protein
MTLGGHRQEARHWEQTLRSPANTFGVDGAVSTETLCLGGRRRPFRRG